MGTILSSLAIKSDGTLWSWGDSGYILGNGTDGDVLVPTRVGTESNWSNLYGGDPAFGIKTDNTMWAWGFGQSGQMGNGIRANSNVPVIIQNCNALATNDQLITNQLAVSPNPTGGFLNIKIPGNLAIDQLTIYDALGKKVIEQNQTTSHLDVSTLHSGLYVLQVLSSGKTFQSKFVKK